MFLFENVMLMVVVNVVSFAVFALIYAVVYRITSNAYRKATPMVFYGGGKGKFGALCPVTVCFFSLSKISARSIRSGKCPCCGPSA